MRFQVPVSPDTGVVISGRPGPAHSYKREDPMADDLTTLRNRQDGLEGRVAQLEVTVEREASLRATMDEDLSNNAETLKAHRALLQALHETQQGHTSTLAQHTSTLAGHTATLAQHTSTLADVQIGVHAILDLLDTHLARKSRWASIAGMLRLIHPQPGSDEER
jgi:chromosome segregation ATPase